MSSRALLVARAVATAVVVPRLARAVRTRPPVVVAPPPAGLTIAVVVPARDEAARLPPLLEALREAPGVSELVVVDDESEDRTAAVAAAGGARVIAGRALPAGWAGKAWALQQGLQAVTADWVVTLDADTRPDPRLPGSLVARAAADRTSLLTVAGRFDLHGNGLRWLHPAMLTTLVYRFGPPGMVRRPRSGRVLANGQCMVLPRRELLAHGGFASVAGSPVEDVALARQLAAAGWSVDFLDAGDLLAVQPYDSIGAAWSGWGRSLGLRGLDPTARRLGDLAVVALTMPLPLVRVTVRRGDALDVALLAVRLGTLVGTRRAYRRHGWAYWCSPLADAAAVAAMGWGAMRRRSSWRGRAAPG